MNENKGYQRCGVFIMILALTILACQGAADFNPFATATPTATFIPTPQHSTSEKTLILLKWLKALKM